MKPVFPFFLAFFLTANLSAQETLQAAHTNEIGLNFTTFLDEAIDFGGTNTLLNPYLFTYKKLDASGRGLRIGAGFNFSRSKGTSDSNNFFVDDPRQFNMGFDLRIGSERQRQIAPRWTFYNGFDGLLGYSFNQLKSGDSSDDTNIESSRVSFGLGPVIGMQFMISERVGLSTEASFYLTQVFGSEKVKFDNSFEEDENNKFNSTNLDFNLPTNLYFFMRF